MNNDNKSTDISQFISEVFYDTHSALHEYKKIASNSAKELHNLKKNCLIFSAIISSIITLIVNIIFFCMS